MVESDVHMYSEIFWNMSIYQLPSNVCDISLNPSQIFQAVITGFCTKWGIKHLSKVHQLK